MSAHTPEVKLDAKWAPLKTIRESPVQPSNIMTTIGTVLYIDSMSRFCRNHPSGSVDREALLRHERVHAFRQKKYGKVRYISKYAKDRAFRWQEEQIANYVEYKYLMSKGWSIDVAKEACILSGPGYYDMITYGEAEQWILDVVNNKWHTDIELPTPVK